MKTLKANKNFLLFGLVFFVAMSVYIMTLAPSITMEDSGELVTAAYTLGIPHPSGYPLFVLLGKLFTFLPLGTIAWRVNLMSACFASLAVALLYLILEKTTKNKIISVGSALMLAFSPVYWSQSVITEVYALNIFFVAVLLYLCLLYWETKNKKLLLWFSFWYGLSLTNHSMNILLAPAFAAFFIYADWKILKKFKLIVAMLGLFVLGLSVYFYIPWRAFQLPIFNWGPITTWSDVWKHLSRAQYNDFSPLSNEYRKIGLVISFFYEIYQQFHLPTLILAFGGAIYWWSKNRPIALLTSGIFLLNSLGIIFLRKFGWGISVDFTYRVYYLPALMIVIFWFASIVAFGLDKIKFYFKDRPNIIKTLTVVIYILIISLPASFVLANYQREDMSSFWLNYDYTRNLLNSLEPNSIYYFAYDGSLQGDTELFSLIYFKDVEGLRPDVSIVTEQQFFYLDLYLALPADYYQLSFEDRRKVLMSLLTKIKNRPLYANYALTSTNNNEHLYSLSNGYAYKVFSNIAEARKSKVGLFLAPIRGLDEMAEQGDNTVLGFISHYYYNLSAYYLTSGSTAQYQKYLMKAFNLDNAPFNHEYRRFLDYRAEWLRNDGG
ncbi:MAG: DUF2723 domain-containing protein [Patescibacteria group bacterium]|nr:DUF2723 domain-containing protein [Patescibacteria group bacterium]